MKYDEAAQLLHRLKRIFAVAALALTSFIACACSTSSAGSKVQPPELSEVYVKHHLVPCKGWEGQDYCFAVADKPNGPWTLVYDGLQNFYYQWGFSYRLLVAPSDEVQKGEDDSDGLRVFKVARKTPVRLGTEFEFSVDPQLARVGLKPHLTVDDGVGQILMGPAFSCIERPVCDEIENRLAADERFVVTFAYGVNGLVAERVAAVQKAADASKDSEN